MKSVDKKIRGLERREMEEELKIAKEFFQEILRLMQIEAEVIAEEREENIHLEIKSNEGALLIGEKGRMLAALETVGRIVLFKKLKRKVPLEVDTEDYRQRQRQRRTKLAQEVAEKVHGTGIEEALSPMSANERRIIHLALKNAESVVTSSEGEGAERHVVIFPKKI